MPKRRRKKKTISAKAQRAWFHYSMKLLKSQLNANQYVIGLDISLHSTGISVLDLTGRLVHSQTTKNSGDSYSEILGRMADTFYDIFERYPPAIIAYEEPTVAGPKNFHSFRALSYATGVMFACKRKTGAILIPVNNTQVKKFETANHKADKELIIDSLNQRGFNFSYDQDDEADATVLAIIARTIYVYLSKYRSIKFNEKYVIESLNKLVSYKKEVIVALFGSGKILKENRGEDVFVSIQKLIP